MAAHGLGPTVSLDGWQVALAGLVSGAAGAGGGDLTADEHRWLEEQAGSDGLLLTTEVGRWWRTFRIRSSAPLTVAALAADAPAVLDRYLDHHAEASSFFLAEAGQFLDFVAGAHEAVPGPPALVTSVVALERAMLELVEAGPTAPPGAGPGLGAVARHPRATMVEMASPPAATLAALLTGGRPPEPGGGPFWLLVAPGIAGFVRAATAGEARLWQSMGEQPVTPGGDDRTALLRLWAAGAVLAYADPPIGA